MTYLLIIFILLIALAPLVWVKSSPRQQQIAELRRLANEQGLQVALSYPPDARSGEGRLDHAMYMLPWLVDKSREWTPEKWALLHHSRRGDTSPWNGWRWLERPRDKSTVTYISEFLGQFTDAVAGLSATSRGLAFCWQEKGTDTELKAFIEALKLLRDRLQNNP